MKVRTIIALVLAVGVPAALSASNNRQRGGIGTSVTHHTNVTRGVSFTRGANVARGGYGYRGNSGYRVGYGYRGGFYGGHGFYNGYGYGVFIDGCFYPNNYPCGYAYPYPYAQTDTVVVPVPTTPAPDYEEQVPPVPVPPSPSPYYREQVPPVPVPPGQPAQTAVSIDPITVAQAEAAAAIAQLNLARAAADLATARLQQLIGTTGQSQGAPPTPAEPSTAAPPPSANKQQYSGAFIQPQKNSGDHPKPSGVAMLTHADGTVTVSIGSEFLQFRNEAEAKAFVKKRSIQSQPPLVTPSHLPTMEM